MEIPKKTRSYSITCEEDRINIENGKYPSYAVSWGDKSNKPHWEKGHDYKKGFKNNTNDKKEEKK
jgi:hypothetical protein